MKKRQESVVLDLIAGALGFLAIVMMFWPFQPSSSTLHLVERSDVQLL